MTVLVWKTGDCVVGLKTDNMLQSSSTGVVVACLLLLY